MDLRPDRGHCRKILRYCLVEPRRPAAAAPPVGPLPGRGTNRRVIAVSVVADPPVSPPCQAGRVRACGPRLLLATLALGISACGGADTEPVDESARLQALVSVKRSDDLTHEEEPRAHALVQFARLPLDADARTTLALAGLQTMLPNPEHCFHPPTPEPSRADIDTVEHLELLAAGNVDVRAAGNVSRLALNLFPPSGAASGVLYTTRDQSPEPLPPSALYSIEVTGSEAIPSLRFDGRAPEALTGLALNGVPVEEARAITRGEPLDLTWAEGDPNDQVYVHVSDDEDGFVCGFRDEDGAGTIASALTAVLSPRSTARVSVHRIRELTVAQGDPRVDALLRFDFELTTSALRVE